jgi:hypothetical protein
MQGGARFSGPAIGVIAVLVLAAALGWWRAIDTGGELERERQAMRAELGQAEVELVARKRAADDSWVRVAKAKQALEDLRQLVAQ